MIFEPCPICKSTILVTDTGAKHGRFVATCPTNHFVHGYGETEAEAMEMFIDLVTEKYGPDTSEHDYPDHP